MQETYPYDELSHRLLHRKECSKISGLGPAKAYTLLLAFWASMGFKPGDPTITGVNEKRTAWHCRVNRVTHPA